MIPGNNYGPTCFRSLSFSSSPVAFAPVTQTCSSSFDILALSRRHGFGQVLSFAWNVFTPPLLEIFT